jgi:hypothetical protein
MVSPCASEATAIAWEIDGAKELIATVSAVMQWISLRENMH